MSAAHSAHPSEQGRQRASTKSNSSVCRTSNSNNSVIPNIGEPTSHVGLSDQKVTWTSAAVNHDSQTLSSIPPGATSQPVSQDGYELRRAPTSLEVNTAEPIAQLLDTVCRELEILRARRLEYVQTIQNLETDIADADLAYGRLTQEWLRIGRARELTRKHMAEDKDQLDHAHGSLSRADQEIDHVLTRIHKLMLGGRR